MTPTPFDSRKNGTAAIVIVIVIVVVVTNVAAAVVVAIQFFTISNAFAFGFFTRFVVFAAVVANI